MYIHRFGEKRICVYTFFYCTEEGYFQKNNFLALKDGNGYNIKMIILKCDNIRIVDGFLIIDSREDAVMIRDTINRELGCTDFKTIDETERKKTQDSFKDILKQL